ncbi:MAG: MarR family transcriptional regulator [Sneathiellaceae bacterium]
MTRQWERERPDLDLSAFVVAAAIKRLDIHIEAAFRRLSQASHGIGTSDMRILLALRRNGVEVGMRPTDLFQSLFITSGAVTKQVDRLIRQGLVTRRPDPDYKRGRLIFLTEKGRRTAEEALQAICSDSTPIGRAICSMTGAELEAGSRFLTDLLSRFEAFDPRPVDGRQGALDPPAR